MTWQDLLKDFENFKTIAEGLAAIGALLIILWKTHQFANKAKEKMGEWDSWRVQTSETLKKTTDTVAQIKSEFGSNGGGSARDALNRIELRQILSDQKLWALHMDSGVGIFETDENGECIKVNRTYLKISGRTETEVMGKGWVLCIAEYDRERVFEEWNNAVEQQREFYLEYDFVNADGQSFPVLGIAHPLRDNKGKIKGWMGLVRPHSLGNKHDTDHHHQTIDS